MATKIVRCGPLVVAGVGAVLSGCTGADMSIAMGPNGPVPPESIGSVSSYGAPPASASTSALASASPLAASPSGSVGSAPLPPSPIEQGSLAPPSSRMASAPSSNMQWQVGPAPAGYPQAAPPAPVRTQLAALPEPEPQPQAERLADTGYAADTGPSGGNSDYAQPALEEPASPDYPQQEQAALAPAADAGPLRPASMRGGEAPASAAREVQFLPVVGAPQREAELLARALSEESQKAGVSIRPAGGPVAPIRLKGYFSAFTDGGDTMLVYVWDVLDSSDQRIRRIQGQERVAGTNADPWATIDLDTMRKVAQETMRQAAGLGADVG
ncbi:hypothetical protein [Aurantimonas sp. 22II-16-19i]|uniref:hypothetical protein n=1 Tax=Aurantimonas sp. 22II-16-19i TaxID=1317114 RepID=UPI0009F7B677|nr:hypothetical protein [Aurantimonas sp. 22II-16-19i]ORE98035.1 hypothetical protein ATO4_05559 [Aurantimonas sp. 22II-16-19i]